MIEHIKSWLKLAEIGQSRSSITNPLQWTMVALLGAALLLLLEHAPVWMICVPFACFLVAFAIFAYAYLYFMHSQPDVLRSEHYHLSKMAIEHGLVGDSIQGLVQRESLSSDTKLLAGQSKAEERPK